MSVVEEVEILAPFFERASAGNVLVVGEIERALDARLGHDIALASACNLLHRHGWHKSPGFSDLKKLTPRKIIA